MTFTEAAVHVLRLVGKPLHYKEITDVAIEKDLLSHVGKSPEVTMGARLAAVVKKGGTENPLSRIKPGVFALAEWDQATIDEGLNDRTPALRKLAQNEAKQVGAASDSDERGEDQAETPSTVSFEAPLDEGRVGMGQDEIARAELTAAATEIFAAEDDDDEPILGRADDDDDDEEDDSLDGAKRHRRRRRRGRGGEREDDLPSYTVSEVSDDVLAEVGDRDVEREARGEGRRREGREGREPREGREGREPREGREAREGREPREGREGREGRNDRDRDRDRRGPRPESRSEDGALPEAAAHDLPGLSEQLLQGFRRQGSVPIKQLAELVGKRQRNGADVSWVSAACRADNLRRQAQGESPRFRFSNGRISLWEWSIDKDQARLEREARLAFDKYAEVLRQRLLRRLSELPPRGFGELAALLLEALDISQFRNVKRPGAHSSELHLAAVQKTALGELPIAIVVRRDGRDIGREQVVELRGSLHHYGQVALGLIVTTGQVMSGAREEASVSGATPVQFIDGVRLAKLCERTGVGVVRQSFQLGLPDLELFDALRSS